MKNTLIVLALFTVVACSKKNDLQVQPHNQLDKNVCDFGITQFNQTKRPFSGLDIEARKRTPTRSGTTTTSTTTTTTTTTTTSGTGAVILLDFDGQAVSGTSWNYSTPTINCAYSGLTQDEINTVVAKIANDYALFNVTVTTDEAVYNAANPNKRTRVIFTETWEWYGQAGGVAYTGSFTWGDNTPCFIFTSLLNYNVHNISEAGAHEAGHTIGLKHQSVYNADCVKTGEYNYGSNGTAPIMGCAYNVTSGSWWVGPNSVSCSSIQDDKSILINALGAK